jgi:hypothetical protein
MMYVFIRYALCSLVVSFILYLLYLCGKSPLPHPMPIRQEPEWFLGPVWMQWKRERCLPLQRIENPVSQSVLSFSP